jgi:hypothetical protein
MPKLNLVAIAALSTAALSACVIAPYPGRAVYGQPSAPGGYYEEPGVVVDAAPPAPYVEVHPAIPFAGAIWIGGYWGWHSNRHHWVPGRWDRPRAGYNWNPHAWHHQGGRWHLRGGGWVRH